MKREVNIFGLSYSPSQIGSYVCVLSESNGHRHLPIIVKPQEAQAIALNVENMESPKPLTHEVLRNVCDTFQIDCQEATIYEMLEGNFYASILLHNGVDETYIETTAGDAIVLAQVFDCPLYVEEKVLSSCGIQMDVEGNLQPDTEKKERIVSLEDLERMMQEAEVNEEYELAAKYRDKIKERKDEN